MTNRIVGPLCLPSMLLACLLLQPGAVEAQPEQIAQPAGQFRFQYAAKILCTSNIPGTSQTTGSVLPGNYNTVVNIHNPGTQTVRLRQKVATALGISKYFPSQLKSDEATRVDCTKITQGFGLTFIHGAEGFLVIESSHSLDVIAVYTAGKRGGEVESIDVEQVQERKLR